MTRAPIAVAFAAFVALAIDAGCGEVPTLPGGVAYITPIQLPSPSVAFGDSMRDSLGRAMPLRVFALGRDSADTIRGVTVRYLLTSLNTGATLGGDGFLLAPESLTTLRVVAQVTGANDVPLQLQTAEVLIPVVPRADSMARTTTDTGSLALPIGTELGVVVTGTGPAGRAVVNGIRVRFQVAAVYPTGAASLRRLFYLVNGNSVLRPDSTIALDTTSSSGAASRTLSGVAPDAGETGPDSVLVTATALSQRGVALAGSPVRFMIRLRR